MAISEPTRNLQAEIGAWVASQFLDRMSHYAREGRRHGGLGADQLRDAWMAAVRVMVGNVRDTGARDRQHDLEAEYRLRREEPPYHLMEAEIALYARRTEALLVDMVRSDPAGLEALSDTVARELRLSRLARQRRN